MVIKWGTERCAMECCVIYFNILMDNDYSPYSNWHVPSNLVVCTSCNEACANPTSLLFMRRLYDTVDVFCILRTLKVA